ncbi:MAG: MBL fold metallo-hydrolase, partial [Gemmatimonadota bacterium]|nr:MBL fold metallo-hydrolase [Gemmatimonadota bacterium]
MDITMTTVRPLGEGTSLVDILHQGNPGVIGTGVLQSTEGLGLVDPGPTACLGALEDGLRELGATLEDVGAVFLTHIHLDHATATGAIVRRSPRARVYVHPRGARHMVDPSRLLASASRIYGDAMERLWGEFVPVPIDSIREVDEGARISFGDRQLEVAYVPGHAKHHVAYFEGDGGAAWIGDVGGIRLGIGPATPVTPPPDIDIELWRESMDRVLAWKPARLVPTHFGPVDEPEKHFAELEGSLVSWSERVLNSLEGVPEEGDSEDPLRAAAFADWVRTGLAAQVSDEALVELYDFASGFAD